VRSDILFTDRLLNPQPEQLMYSKFNDSEDLAAFSRKFDEGAKKVFSVSSSHTDQYIKFLSPRDSDPSCGIRGGRLRLTG